MLSESECCFSLSKLRCLFHVKMEDIARLIESCMNLTLQFLNLKYYSGGIDLEVHGCAHNALDNTAVYEVHMEVHQT